MSDMKAAMADELARELVAAYEKGRRDGIEAAAKLMEENAAEWRKASGYTQPNIAWQLDSEARHIRELLKEKP